MLGEVRQQLADLGAALAVLLKLPRAGQHLGAGVGGVVVFDLAGEFLAVELVELGLGIEEIDLARAALHEHRDHRLRLRGVRRLLRQQIVMRSLERRLFRRAEQAILLQQPGEAKGAEVEAARGEEMAAAQAAGRLRVHGREARR